MEEEQGHGIPQQKLKNRSSLPSATFELEAAKGTGRETEGDGGRRREGALLSKEGVRGLVSQGKAGGLAEGDGREASSLLLFGYFPLYLKVLSKMSEW